MIANNWQEIAEQNQALLTQALEKLAKAERERDKALEVLADILCDDDGTEDD